MLLKPHRSYVKAFVIVFLTPSLLLKSSIYKLWSCAYCWSLTSHVLELVCLCAWPPTPLLKSSIYILWPCAYCCSPKGHMSKLVCLCACPPSPLLKSSIYKLWPCAYCWSPTGHMSKPVCLCAWYRARFWNPVYINYGPVLAVEAPQGICQNLCACVPNPEPASRIQYI